MLLFYAAVLCCSLLVVLHSSWASDRRRSQWQAHTDIICSELLVQRCCCFSLFFVARVQHMHSHTHLRKQCRKSIIIVVARINIVYLYTACMACVCKLFSLVNCAVRWLILHQIGWMWVCVYAIMVYICWVHNVSTYVVPIPVAVCCWQYKSSVVFTGRMFGCKWISTKFVRFVTNVSHICVCCVREMFVCV